MPAPPRRRAGLAQWWLRAVLAGMAAAFTLGPLAAATWPWAGALPPQALAILVFAVTVTIALAVQALWSASGRNPRT